MPADKKRKGYSKGGRLTGLDLARIKRLITQTSGSGGPPVATELFGRLQQGVGTHQNETSLTLHTASQLSAAVTTTLTTVLDITDASGVLLFAGLVTGGNWSINNNEVIITIDDTIVFTDATIGALDAQGFYAIVGSYFNDSTNDKMALTENAIPFSSSLKIQIKSGSSNSVKLAYRYYST